jgi:3-isopropylmalate/(R)-2-methylmalate dehydratase small subunit
LARDNFGCGSSREHAPWALEDYGFRVILASSFADIFFNNCFKNGLLPIVLERETIASLFDAVMTTPGYELSVDLAAQLITQADGSTLAFEVDAFRKHCLLNGLDDIALTLEDAEDIRQFEQRWQQLSPWYFTSS